MRPSSQSTIWPLQSSTDEGQKSTVDLRVNGKRRACKKIQLGVKTGNERHLASKRSGKSAKCTRKRHGQHAHGRGRKLPEVANSSLPRSYGRPGKAKKKGGALRGRRKWERLGRDSGNGGRRGPAALAIRYTEEYKTSKRHLLKFSNSWMSIRILALE